MKDILLQQHGPIYPSAPWVIDISNQRVFNGNLTIKKEITDGVPEDEEFTIKVKLIDGATDLPTEYEYTGSKDGTLIFEDGVATITLKANESIKIEGLPIGATYQIDEETDEYDVSYDNNNEKITEDSTITVTNSIKPEEPEPEEPEPEDPEPEDPEPEDPEPEDPEPEDPEPEEPAPEDPKPEEPEPEEPTPEDPAPEEPTPVEPAPVEPTPDDHNNPQTSDNIFRAILIALFSVVTYISSSKLKKLK